MKAASLWPRHCPALVDLTSVAALRHLEVLVIQDCRRLRDLWPLAHLPKLRELRLVCAGNLTDMYRRDVGLRG